MIVLTIANIQETFCFLPMQPCCHTSILLRFTRRGLKAAVGGWGFPRPNLAVNLGSQTLHPGPQYDFFAEAFGGLRHAGCHFGGSKNGLRAINWTKSQFWQAVTHTTGKLIVRGSKSQFFPPETAILAHKFSLPKSA
ncbi:unnamed protein product [Bodo saltans]|uniref:Uncharacterized protein n=1 Tax=Bodo saltans TaxID=75058 RepID=A0A0S4IP27_BODSA|nr:unnamed protein product [Bodo saltans]|eukprot:CUE72433.1 unnamed protein product [Bodo saltans]